MRKLLPLLLLLFALPAKAQTYGQAFFYGGAKAGGSGTVTSVATTAPITGGTITTTGTIGCATCVTSAAALTSNAVVIGGGLQASSTISADTTTTHALFATAGAPAFRALASGDLPAIAIPATVSSATSGGIPCFDSTTDMNTSAALTNHAILQGGGAGACPGVGNGDFTIDSTAHTLKGGAAGLVDLSAQTGVNSFLVPTIANCSPTTNGAMCFNSNNYFVIHAANVTEVPMVTSTSLLNLSQIPKSSNSGYPIYVASSISDNGTTVTTTEPVNAAAYQTATNCAANGTAANPSVVSCSSAAAGMFSCATNASTGTCTVNTTRVTANSEIQIIQDAADGGASQLNVTCNTGNVLSATAPFLAAKVAATSFTINLGTVTTNPACFEYIIVN